MYKLFINGELVEGEGVQIDVLDPADNSVITKLNTASPEQCNQALEAAQAAFKSWAATPIGVRCDWLNKYIDAVMEDAEKIAEILDAAEEYIDEARRAVRSKGIGDYNRSKGVVPAVMTATAYQAYARGRSTKPFIVTDDCTGCGLCQEICPCGAVVLNDGKPVWEKPQCVQCLGCLHRCPARAIRWKKEKENQGRYYNPRVKP